MRLVALRSPEQKMSLQSIVVCRTERDRKCNRLRDALQAVHDAIIRVCVDAGNVIETREQAG